LNKSQFVAVVDSISRGGVGEEVTDEVEMHSECAVPAMPSNGATDVDQAVVSCSATTDANVPSSIAEQVTLSHREEDENVTTAKSGVHFCTVYLL